MRNNRMACCKTSLCKYYETEYTCMKSWLYSKLPLKIFFFVLEELNILYEVRYTHQNK